MTPLTVILSRPRGFCAGVVRAVDIVERALRAYGPPIYVRHEIVHNKAVVEDLAAKGAVFVDDVDEIPEGALTIFSAHGVSKAVEAMAAERSLDVIDATCPLVRKVHKEGNRYLARGYDVILVGHAGHAEITGTMGQINGPVHLVSSIEDVAKVAVADDGKVAYITQTTLSLLDTRDIIAALRQRFPAIVGPDTRDICYATQNRQTAALKMIELVDAMMVVGSRNSSNSNRLVEIGLRAGLPSFMIDSSAEIEPWWLSGVGVLGLTAGASAPESVVQEVIRHLSEMREVKVETINGPAEPYLFSLPDRLRDVEPAVA